MEAMRKEGLTKEDVGREGFLERAWAWKNEYGGRIVRQTRRMGNSCDWSRERFTMDEGCSRAVTEVFNRLYEKGLIYRGNRMINWCPCCSTSISDAEVEYETQNGHFWHLLYRVKETGEQLELATTRPETMLGDTAVAVNGEDPRYAHLRGCHVILPLIGREIPIVCDEHADMTKGTGVVKITPAHDPNDFEVGQRHNLPLVRVFTYDGHMTGAADKAAADALFDSGKASVGEPRVLDCGKYAGMPVMEARKAIVADLEAEGCLKKVEPITHEVGTCYRCHTTIEPMVSKQWFVKMAPLAKPAIECVKNGVTTIFDHHASFFHIPDSLFALEEAGREVGIRRCLCYEISDRDGEEKMREAVLENERFIRHALADRSGMTAGMMGLHASFTLSDETLAFAEAHRPDGVGYHVHVAEGAYDLEHCQKTYGMRLVERLHTRGILGPKTLAAHCIYVNEAEMDLLRETDTMVVHNPQSNMGNACGCPPTMAIFHKGILTGLGTDGYTHDMIESAKAANLLHKHHLQDPNAAWNEVMEMLFVNNANIAGRYFDLPLGALKPGYGADIIATDYIPITPMDGDNCNGHILFGMNGRSVIHTVCNGKVLMRDRKLTFCDEEALCAATREGARQLWASING